MERAGMEIIPKFEIKYPEYEVVTPHSNKSYTLRSLTVGEEESLKGSLLTPVKLTNHLNQCLWSAMVNKPEGIKTFDDFLKQNTPRDRDALIYGLYHITYKDIHNYDVTCQKCEHVNSVKVKFGDSFSMIAWKDEKSILDIEKEVPLEIADQVVAIVAQPTLWDEQKLLDDLAFSSDDERDKQIDLLSIRRFEINIKEQVNERDKIKDRSNIKRIFNDLPATDRKLIEKTYGDVFGKYGVSLKTVVKCQNCQHENDTEIDLMHQFFRSMFE